jgi:hypothetical protein
MLRTPSRRTVARIALALVATATLAACGGSPADDVPDDAVATVNGTPITQASFDRWFAITKRENAFAGAEGLDEDDLRARVLSTLIRARWVRGEAEELGITVPKSEFEKEWKRTTKLQYVGGKDFEQYMKETGLTEDELRYRIETGKINIFLMRASQARAGGAEAPDVDKKMLAYNRDYTDRWTALTVCAEDLVIADCSNYEGQQVGSATDPGAADAGTR